MSEQGERSGTAKLALGAIGVVYGDIGTSPLYTIREAFHGAGLPATPANVVGLLSLVVWSLLLVVTVKYVTFILRADNRGEGGILALMALAQRRRPGRLWMIAVGLFGAALFYGDGIITPAISVLSAVEGLKIETPAIEPYVVPIALVILVALFLVQRYGTGNVAVWFGPIMAVWFATLVALGLLGIARHPGVLRAFDPLEGVAFFAANGWLGFVILGAVVLAVTGAEALYADMGHFGRRPIRVAWIGCVLPALVLNYLGQGALILDDPAAIENPFFLMAPQWALLPLVVLATAATIIASQAVISGVFSLTQQAVLLDFLPRMAILHTSEHQIGQIYLPRVNGLLLIGVVVLVLEFQSSSALAAAYGVAVTGTMVATSLLSFIIIRHRWNWPLPAAAALSGMFLLVDGAFLGATLLKVDDGGWMPLLVGAAIWTIMATWHHGRSILRERLAESALPLDIFLQRLTHRPYHRVPGTAVYMTGNGAVVPYAFLHNLKHNKVLHERIVLLTVTIADVPRVAPADRATIEFLATGFVRITMHFGFIDTPDVP
ncbi:MAG: potassium transporter Kup, partial [Alphaproteobacteria bacterium]